jgi:RimJ/RimL family protein N-acetyltransferase
MFPTLTQHIPKGTSPDIVDPKEAPRQFYNVTASRPERIVVPQFIGIATDNLMLRPLSPAELLALREGDEQFAAESNLKPADGLRAMLVSDDVSPAWLERLRTAVDRDPWRFGYVVLETMTGIALGMAGFKGPPDDHGVVEIAYGIAPSYRGRGDATQQAKALGEYARGEESVHSLGTRTRFREHRVDLRAHKGRVRGCAARSSIPRTAPCGAGSATPASGFR